jgi:hypothetical protein
MILTCNIVGTVELGVEASPSHQLVVIARLGHLALLHHKNDVRVSDCGQAVSYDDTRAAHLRFI